MKAHWANMISFIKRHKLIPLIAFVCGGGYLFKTVLFDIIPYPYGDGLEYISTTEALYHHLSPNVEADDMIMLKSESCKYMAWKDIGKSEYIDKTYDFLSKTDNQFMDNTLGLFTALNGKQYSYHFFFYSLMNVPARIITSLFNINPFQTFPITNICLILLVCALVLFKSPFDDYTSLIIAAIFYFSPVHWYITWPHPEVFTACFVFAGLWLYFQGQYYLPMLLISIAALQNQPLILLVMFIGLSLLINKKFGVKNVMIIAFSLFITLLPSWFYYNHFRIPNLVKHLGYLDSQYITFTRVFGFFFDLNQGAIIAIPLILLVYVALSLKDGWLFLKNKIPFNLNILLLVVVVAIAITVSTMNNWNHGQSVINRYAVWVSIIILVHFLFMFKLNKFIAKLFLTICLATQFYTVKANEGIRAVEWTNFQHKKFAKWVIEHYPQLYNPDPQIFCSRTIQKNSEYTSDPIVYWSEKGDICKVMVSIDQIQTFRLPGASDEKMKKIRHKLHFVNGWAYINKSDIYGDLSIEETNALGKELKILFTVNKIKENSEWYNLVVKKAEEQHINIDEMIRRDATFVVEQEMQKQN